MAKYKYTATDENNIIQTGLESAENMDHLFSILKKRKLKLVTAKKKVVIFTFTKKWKELVLL